MPDAFQWSDELRRRFAEHDLDPAREAEIIDELAQHLNDEAADLMAHGVSPDDARAQLIAVLDDPASRFPRDLLRRRRAIPAHHAQPASEPTIPGFLESIRYDLVHGVRNLLRAPALTAVIVLSLATVIGANTAIFGLMDSVLLRRLPIPHSEQLVALRPMNGGHRATVRYADYKTLMKGSGVPALEAYVPVGATVGTRADHSELWIELVTGGYFDLIGVAPLLGRTLSRADETSAAPVAVVSEDYWRQHLGADRAAVGRSILVNDAPFTVIGVMPRRFAGIFFAHRFTLAMPLTSASTFDDGIVSRYNVALIARLPHGANDRVAAMRFSSAFLRCCLAPAPGNSSRADVRQPLMPADAPVSANGGWQDTLDTTPHVTLLDASRGITWSVDFRGQYERILMALMAGVLVLLLIACANVGTLLLARAAAREREFAIRMSLGARRSRILRQLFTESLELAVAGAAVGLLLAWLGTAVLLHNLPGNALQLGDVIAWRTSPAILGFTVLACVISTVVFGAWPARRASRADILASLTGAGRARGSSRGISVDNGLAIAQIALALVLVTAATLFITTLRRLEHDDGGYHTRNVLLARVEQDSIGRVAQAMIDELAQLPGVEATGVSYSAPVIGDSFFYIQTEVPGRAPVPNERPPETNIVSAGYFAATGIGLRAGRDFTVRDDGNAEQVAIVSEAFAHRYFGDRNPIGQSIITTIRTRQTRRIIGVANDALYSDLHGKPSEIWYMPLAQWNALARPQRWIAVAVRTTVDAPSLAPMVRKVVDARAPGARIRTIASVGQLMDDALAKERFAAALATIFGLVALGLAVLGVYGVIAYDVTRRIPEIGVRMALGATARDAIWLVTRQTLIMALAGVSIGVPLAYAASRAIASQLAGVGAGNPWVMFGTATLLAVAGVAGGIIPGRRAARVDPIIALRSQ